MSHWRTAIDWSQLLCSVSVELAKATADRCQPGLQTYEQWAKDVVAMSCALTSEMQYAFGRHRPDDQEEHKRIMEELSRLSKEKSQ
jgi:hypothetical protein